MRSQEILEKYINFYQEKGHKVIPNVSLIPENDPTLLFVNSGMFPLVPYLSGQPHPMGKRLVNIQRSLRFEDIEEVGISNRHTVAFHMLGNWSLGDYFKEEQLPWVYEFLVEVLGLDINRMYASVFEGDEFAPKDDESVSILQQVFKKYGIEAKEGERIFSYGRGDNWWQRGEAVGELGGPDSEIFYYIGTEGNGLGRNPADNQDDFIEIGNSVFMQYVKTETGWEELSQKNVDFGGGLERLALAVQGKQDIYLTDNFLQIVQKIEEISGKKYGSEALVTKSMRVEADHIRACVFLAMDGVLPSNKDQGYVLRRLIRRMVRAGRVLGVERDLSVSLTATVVKSLEWLYPPLSEKQAGIEGIFVEEENKFRKTLEKGSLEFKKVIKDVKPNETALAGKAFDLYQSVGYPAEIFVEDWKDLGNHLNEKKFYQEFERIFREHKDASRKGAEQKFTGGLADHSEEVVKYHTATHLLHKALREVLGEQVVQQGSNITSERLRFDFNYPQKLTEEEIAKVVGLMNNMIKKAYSVGFKVMPREEAEKTGAIQAFGEKYGDNVKVYYIGDSLEEAVSKEFCGGPHVENTSKLKPINIYKQESIGKGIMRIYARFAD
jgi:alanyl-tRNA synthetase